MWAVGIAVLWTGLQVFPDGRPVSPGWRWGLWVGIVGVVAALGAAALAWPLRDVLRPTGDFERYTGAAGVAAAVAVVGSFGSVPVAVAALVARYRRGRATERLQLRWLMSACAVEAAGIAFFFSPGHPTRPTQAWPGVRLQHDHDIEVMARDLRAAVDATVKPAHVALWIRRQPEVR